MSQPQYDHLKGVGCACGRSPTGICNGWHNLTEEQYKKGIEKWRRVQEEKKKKKSLNETQAQE